MTLKSELQKVQNELAAARADLGKAIQSNDIRKRNEISKRIAELQTLEAALIPAVASEQNAAAEWEAQETSPEARRERKQIEQMRADIDSDVLKLYRDAGALMQACFEFRDRVKAYRKLLSKHSQDKNNAAIEAGNNKNVRAVDYLLTFFYKLRESIQLRPDLAKHFPKGD